MKVLVINSGSSSVKYEVFEGSDFTVLSSGLLERIGEGESRHVHRAYGPEGTVREIERRGRVDNHREGFRFILSLLVESPVIKNPAELVGIGHRVVHGGEDFKEAVLIDKDVLERIRALIPLAPLHNPANLLGIEAAREIFPGVPHVAVFDTAFHQSMPPHAYMYSLPYSLYALHRVRRYGFHGTSHLWVAKKAAAHLGKPLESLRLITLHLGNGASAAAIREGRSVDTSMGMTPLEGLVMGTRCGDLDPAVSFYLRRATGMPEEDLEALLNKGSGLKGICGVNDMREVIRMESRGEPLAQLALELYCYRIKKYVGAYFAALGRVDAIVFTGGVGENASVIRKRACEGLEHLGVAVDGVKNETASGEIAEIGSEDAPVRVLVVRTDEEREIAQQTVSAIERVGRAGGVSISTAGRDSGSGGTNAVSNYRVIEILRDQRSVTIRAVRPDDKGLFIDALGQVGPESRYTRFFAPKKEFTASELQQATEVDFVNVVALVAVLEKDGKDRIAGGGRYVRIEGTGQTAEVAFLVEDAFQGLGIASRLFKHLVAIARDVGITRFEAEVLPSNDAMLRVFERGGVPVTRTLESGTFHVVMDLNPPHPPSQRGADTGEG